jgi:four helix bundle protein
MFEPEKYLQLNDVNAYKMSYSLSNKVWVIVAKWPIFAKNTVGTQYVRAIDSISANIAEGFGRYFKKDKILFFRIARGSVMESLDWTLKAKERGFLGESQYEEVIGVLKQLPKYINQLIGYTKDKLKE